MDVQYDRPIPDAIREPTCRLPSQALDNAFIERLWHTVKYEDIYTARLPERPRARPGLTDYFRLYNHVRPCSALGGGTPAEVHWASLPIYQPLTEETHNRSHPLTYPALIPVQQLGSTSVRLMEQRLHAACGRTADNDKPKPASAP